MSDEQATRVKPERNRGGEWVTLGDEQYRIPPLAFRAVIDLQDRVAALAQMGGRPTPDQMDTVADIVHAAMVRNYPALTKEQVGDMLDLGNYQAVLSAVLSIGGFKKAGAESGEPQASAGTPPTAP